MLKQFLFLLSIFSNWVTLFCFRASAVFPFLSRYSRQVLLMPGPQGSLQSKQFRKPWFGTEQLLNSSPWKRDSCCKWRDITGTQLGLEWGLLLPPSRDALICVGGIHWLFGRFSKCYTRAVLWMLQRCKRLPKVFVSFCFYILSTFRLTLSPCFSFFWNRMWQILIVTDKFLACSVTEICFLFFVESYIFLHL